MPKVSVWLTSYNHGEQLRESIESVLNQSYQDYELVIVDDCSTDRSREIIDEYSNRNPKIKTVFHERNIGSSGLKHELENLKGEYVAILHGDDKWDASKLEKQVDVLDNHAHIAACFTGVRVINLEGKVYTGSHNYSQVFKTDNRSRFDWLRYFFYNGNCLCHPSILIRKKAYKQYDLLTCDLMNSLPDFDKWIKLCFSADIYVIPEELTFFRVHEDETNQSADTEQKQNRLFLEEYFVYQNYLCIDNMQTLKNIFPQAEKYENDSSGMVEFALARILTEGPRNSQRLLGLNLLYKLLQDKEKAEKIKEIYNYGKREFDQDEQKADIFGNIPRTRFLMTTLYIDTGNGYNEVETIKKRIYIPATGLVQITYDLQERFAEKDIKGIRFDLDEGIYRKSSIVRGEWADGESVEIRSINGIAQKDWDYFYTLDPQYEIRSTKKDSLHLLLKVEEILVCEVEQYYSIMENERKMLEKKLEKNNRMLEESSLLIKEYRSSRLINLIYKIRKRLRKRNM